MIGEAEWDIFVRDTKMTPSNAAAGGKYNGQDLKKFLLPKNLEQLALRIPNNQERVQTEETHAEIIINYLEAIDKLHTMCVAKSVIPYNVWGILREFRDTFTKAYKLDIGLSATTKIHICWVHIPEWFMLEETGKETLYTADCGVGESCHGAIRRMEESRNLESRYNRGSDRERRALESTLAQHNYGTDMILDPSDQVAKVNAVEVTEELNNLALTSEVGFLQMKEYILHCYLQKVSDAVAADVVVDFNGNMVNPCDHSYTSAVPLMQDERTKHSLIKVIISLSFGFRCINLMNRKLRN